MRPESLELESKARISVSQTVLQKLKTSSPNVSGNAAIEAEFLGGVIRSGQLGWFANGSSVEVFSLKSGQRVAGHSFDEKSIVTCIAEVTSNDIHSCLLIIAVQRSQIGGLLYLFSVQGSRIVHRIDVIDKITSCCFISDAVCNRGNLKAFNGCAAVGTDAGEVFLIDLNLNRCKEIISRQKPFNHNSDDSSCKILSAPIEHDEIRQHVKQTRAENINLGIRLDFSVIEQPSAISSILSMPQMQMIVVGLENGILALFNLNDLNALHLAYPPEIDSPLVKLTFLEPADDPRPCVYIWAFHANTTNFPFAVMHAVTFSSKTYQDGENMYETFQWCRPDLTIPIYEKDSIPIQCQSVTKIVTEEEDEQYSLCLLAWTNRVSSFVLVFDLNQWYKEQMPRVCDWRDYPSYLAPFPIEIVDTPFDIWLNPKSVVTFNSIQRPEEHFYPTSVSFELIELTSSIIHKLQWGGLQNNAIKKLSNMGAVAILVPDECFTEFLEASLIPQLSDQNYHANPSKKMKQEFLLSMALEYNCMGLLRECAHHWADGSHMGKGSSDGLTLSTLTEWIWNQATLIKDRCNDLCISLFDDSGITIDLRSRKILAHYSRQLKLLAELLHLIITNYREYIPDEIFDTLTAQRNSIRMTSEYQEVLQWLLNMGLLPEIVWNQSTLPEPKNDTFTATPYPYRILSEFYTEQRQRFYDIDRNNITPKTNSCKCLYIDSFIDRECNSHLLKNEWSNGLGDGLYPPPSLQAMLRILLIPGISLENKYMLFVYLFLDLHFFLEGEHFDVVQNLIKFPAVFKLNSSLIKTTQAFWNLDHNEFEVALRELISPLTSDRFITQWQQELLVNTLLIRDVPHLALQAIRAPGPSINTSLRIKTLLANNLITEAFELQRSKFDENLLIEFFKGCHDHKKWNYVLGLSLTEREGEILCKFLRTCDSLLSENLQLLYLLQRNKYIDALTYLDDTKNKLRSQAMHRKLENTQDLIMSSYKLAMNSTNRTLCDQYMTIKNRLDVDAQQNSDEPKPLSSELNPFIVDANANVVGSVFHRAIVSAKRTGFNTPLSKNHIPLLGNIRIELDSDEIEDYKPILEPQPYIGIMKRRKEITYENQADPDSKQPAAKRQRIDSFSIVDVPMRKPAPGIKSFLLSSLTNHSFAGKKLQLQDEMDDVAEIDMTKGPRNSLGELCDTVNLLSTPVVKSSRLEKHSRIESRCQTPQSILKQRHTEIGSTISRRSTSPSLTVNSARRSVDFNAKPFCYTIPSVNDEYRLGAIEETLNVQDDDDSSSQHSPSSIKGRRPIHSAKNSTASNSIDEFYSPETSKVQNEMVEQHAHEMDNNDLSRISHNANAQTPTTSHIKSRRNLRSKTPEPPALSSTRITRSRSKLNLDDTVESEDVTQQPFLNTSTPKRTTTPRRSPARSLSKNVVKSNALKAQTETNSSTKLSKNNDSIEMRDEAKQRNYLKDASEMSLKQRSLQSYSIDEMDATQSRQNLLQDSSSFASTLSFEKEQSLKDRTDALKDNNDATGSVQAEPETTEELSTEQMQEDFDEVEKEIQSEIDEAVNVENEIPEETVGIVSNVAQNDDQMEAQNVESTETLPITPEPEEYAGKLQPTVQVTETVTEETTITITKKLPQNYLVDSSMAVNDSMMQKFSRYEHYTTSFFSDTQHGQNLLEDSSICTPFGTQETTDSKSNADSEKEVVNIDDLDDDSESESSSNNTISSDSESDIEGNLIYDDSDNEENNENAENNEVIQISSSSEDDNESNKSIDDFGETDSQQNFNDYDNLKYDINQELGIATTPQPTTATEYRQIEDYNITELQSAPLHLDVPPTNMEQNVITQEQAMNEMIYGDLDVADAEMLDLDVHNHAFGFEMHGHRTEENQGGIYLDAVEMSTSSNEQLMLDHAANAQRGQQTNQNVEIALNTEIVADKVDHIENVETTESVNAAVEDKANEPIDANENENIPEIQTESKIPDVPNQTEATSDETNILEQAVIIDDTSANATQAAQTQPESANEKPNEVIEMEVDNEATNIFDNAAGPSILDASEPVQQEVTISTEKENEPETIETKELDVEETHQTKHVDTVEKESGSKRPRTPSRRTRRAASQQESGDKEDVPIEQVELTKVSRSEKSEHSSKVEKKSKKDSSKESQSDAVEVESTEEKPKSRSTRAKSQQRTIEPSTTEADRKKSDTSKNREFSIKLSRTETQELLQKTLSEESDASKDVEPVRRKRSALQQKEQPKSQNEPNTSKATIPKRQRTRSVTESELGDKFDAEESVSSRRLRKATSQQSLSDIAENVAEESTAKKGRSPSRTKTEKGAPRRAASHQSLSSISDNENKPSEETERRSTRRAMSQQRLDDIDEKIEVKVPRRKKQKSESTDSESELGERFDADESTRSRRLRKATSHQTLSKIVENAHEDSPAKKTPSKSKKEPTTPPRTRRAVSHQSLAEDETDTVATVKKTPSRKRTKSESSETAPEKDETGSTRSRSRSRAPSETKQSPAKLTTQRSTRSSKKDDDSHSEASSIVSSRSRKGGATNDDETSSVKSSRVRSTRSASVLPAIPEDDQAKNIVSQEYLESSRLTRSQRATIEKYSKLKKNDSEVGETSTRRSSRKAKAHEEEDGSEHSDTESILSQKSTDSKVSKASKKSKTSEASSSQRSTRQRSQKK